MSNAETIRRRGPSPDKTAATRRNIVAAGLDAFLAKGFGATRMTDVATRAGVAKGTLYLYFADKEALFEGTMHDILAVPIAALGALAPVAGESVKAFLLRVMLPMMRDMEVSGRSALVRLAIAEAPHFPKLLDAYKAQALGPMLDLARRLAVRAYAAGEIGCDAPVRYPQLLIAPGLITAVWNGFYGDGPERIDGEALFRAHLDLIFGTGPGTV